MVRSGQALDVLLTEIETTIGLGGWALADEARLRHPSVAVIYTSVRERTRAGLKAAAARGRKGGRQPKLTPEQKAEILDGLGSGRKSAADLARLFRVHRTTISRLAAQVRVIAPGEGLA